VEPIDMLRSRMQFEPIFPDRMTTDASSFAFAYDAEADTLYIHFFGAPRPAVSVAMNEYFSWRISRETHEVVGVQVEGFLAYVVREHPEWLPLAEVLAREGIVDAGSVDEIRRVMRPEAALRPLWSTFQVA
jgi:uncharacterized protein YuzE